MRGNGETRERLNGALPIERLPFGIDEPEHEITAVHLVEFVTVAAADAAKRVGRRLVIIAVVPMRMVSAEAPLRKRARVLLPRTC